LRDTEGAMQLFAKVMARTSHCRAALAAVLVASFALCAFGGTATSTMVRDEVTLQVEPLKAVVKQGEEIGMMVVFVGGAHETTLILPLGVDLGIITFRVIEVASGREWAVADRDSRSVAGDVRQRLPAGERLELRRRALEFKAPDNSVVGNLPAGTYRIVAIYDEGKAFYPTNQTSRILRSEPVDIVVTVR